MRVIVKDDGTVGKVIVGIHEETRGVELFYPAKQGNYYETDLKKLSEMKYTEGTEQDYISFIEKDLIWGTVVKTHVISEYQIIEYVDRHGNIVFHPYINFNDTNHCYSSLDKAVVGAIVYKHEGPNSDADSYFWKMIS